MKIIAKLIGLERFSKFIVGDFIMKKAIAYTLHIHTWEILAGIAGRQISVIKNQNRELITFELALSMAEESIDEM